MKIWQLHSWDVKKKDDGSVVFCVHRHDGSVLEVPMGFRKNPASPSGYQFVVMGGDCDQYYGYASDQWVPQS